VSYPHLNTQPVFWTSFLLPEVEEVEEEEEEEEAEEDEEKKRKY